MKIAAQLRQTPRPRKRIWMTHRPVRLSTAALLSFCLLAWGKDTSVTAAAAGTSSSTSNNENRRLLRGAHQDDHDRRSLFVQHGDHKGIITTTSPLPPSAALDNTAALAPAAIGLGGLWRGLVVDEPHLKSLSLVPTTEGDKQQDTAATATPPAPDADASSVSSEPPPMGRIPLESMDEPAPDVLPPGMEAAKDPHAPPPGTYFQRNRPNGGNNNNNNNREVVEGEEEDNKAAAAAPVVAGTITLESVPSPANEAAKDPHAPPPGTYFQRNRPNANNNRAVEGEEEAVSGGV